MSGGLPTPPALVDFTYPGGEAPSGVMDSAIPPNLRALIEAMGPSIDDGLGSRRLDCRYACDAWRRAFARHGVACLLSGGEGVDDEVTRGHRLVPLDRRSGYRESDGLIHRHYWLRIGADRHLFDPTAHQFDRNGGVALERYLVDGIPLAAGRLERVRPTSAR
jgi:hypothetical protein